MPISSTIFSRKRPARCATGLSFIRHSCSNNRSAVTLCWLSSRAGCAWNPSPVGASFACYPHAPYPRLLADGVGLGKTIQAGLVLTELVARRIAHRILIVSPATLLAQWKEEIRERFGLRLEVIDRATLEEVHGRTNFSGQSVRPHSPGTGVD